MLQVRGGPVRESRNAIIAYFSLYTCAPCGSQRSGSPLAAWACSVVGAVARAAHSVRCRGGAAVHGRLHHSLILQAGRSAPRGRAACGGAARAAGPSGESLTSQRSARGRAAAKEKRKTTRRLRPCQCAVATVRGLITHADSRPRKKVSAHVSMMMLSLECSCCQRRPAYVQVCNDPRPAIDRPIAPLAQDALAPA